MAIWGMTLEKQHIFVKADGTMRSKQYTLRLLLSPPLVGPGLKEVSRRGSEEVCIPVVVSFCLTCHV